MNYASQAVSDRECDLCPLRCYRKIILQSLHLHILHIAFRWLPFPIGQVCAHIMLRRSYLAANFGFIAELRTLPWSPSKVEESAFTPSLSK